LAKYLDQQGFSLVGYGCTTCIGNSGDLHEAVAEAITENGKFSVCLQEGNEK
jgi:aconitate hydratase